MYCGLSPNSYYPVCMVIIQWLSWWLFWLPLNQLGLHFLEALLSNHCGNCEERVFNYSLSIRQVFNGTFEKHTPGCDYTLFTQKGMAGLLYVTKPPSNTFGGRILHRHHTASSKKHLTRIDELKRETERKRERDRKRERERGWRVLLHSGWQSSWLFLLTLLRSSWL